MKIYNFCEISCYYFRLSIFVRTFAQYLKISQVINMAQEEKNWYDTFIEILYKRHPKKQDLVQELMDLLYIEREAVYRRLRQDVIFTAHEMAKIAIAWNISLDDIISVNTDTVSFQMRKMNYINPSQEEFDYLRNVIQGIRFAKKFPTTELMDICNKLPRQVLAGYPYLNQFYLFKWQYQYGNENEIIPYSQIIVSEEQSKLTNDYFQAIKLVPNSSFVLDRLLFDYLISDIQYFYSIRMISDQEKGLIKQDLFSLLAYMQAIATKGCYPETQNKVNLYISHLNVDTNYSYVFTPDINICFVHVFEKFEIHTYNAEMAANFRSWMQLKKRSSMQISEVDERSRIAYFSKQQKLIESL